MEAALTLNPDGTYAVPPMMSLPKPTFLTSSETEGGWDIEAEWFLGRVGNAVKVTASWHPLEGIQFLRITDGGSTGIQIEESWDPRDLLRWLTEEAR